MTEGYLQYHINVEAADTSAETRQNVMMLKNSKMEIYFAEDLSRIDFTMGKVGATSVVLNKKNHIALTTTKSPMGNFATQKTVEDSDLNSSQQDTNAVIVETKETKKILGYDCRKIFLKSNGKISTYWITDQIDVNETIGEITNRNIPGFPMAFSTQENGMVMEYKLSNIKYELENKSKVFSTEVPEGYTLVQE